MQIIERRINVSVEGNRVLGELQNGFRRRTRIEDNLFMIMQCTEIAEKCSRSLFVGFLDIKGTKDNVNRGKI